MRFFWMAWRVFVNVATGAVILAMFHFANSRFETILTSALVLIYVAGIGAYISIGYALSRKWDIDLARHISIAKALNLNTGIEEEAQTENQVESQKSQALFWIASSFNMLFGLIAIRNLLYAIVS